MITAPRPVSSQHEAKLPDAVYHFSRQRLRDAKAARPPHPPNLGWPRLSPQKTRSSKLRARERMGPAQSRHCVILGGGREQRESRAVMDGKGSGSPSPVLTPVLVRTCRALVSHCAALELNGSDHLKLFPVRCQPGTLKGSLSGRTCRSARALLRASLSVRPEEQRQRTAGLRAAGRGDERLSSRLIGLQAARLPRGSRTRAPGANVKTRANRETSDRYPSPKATGMSESSLALQKEVKQQPLKSLDQGCAAAPEPIWRGGRGGGAGLASATDSPDPGRVRTHL
ncbi:hypothetical protein AAFF_G00441120 [Aldrovandia affinis]|uniref:Uncharacterized protein n=1 Tax=Aldrovandia affinis TaxID=143900 RepID=A0AAD7S7L0_9TELE|nr:hypothetical protein AAFF_G00441120 [Aldrovandia affinis]